MADTAALERRTLFRQAPRRTLDFGNRLFRECAAVAGIFGLNARAPDPRDWRHRPERKPRYCALGSLPVLKQKSLGK